MQVRIRGEWSISFPSNKHFLSTCLLRSTCLLWAGPRVEPWTYKDESETRTRSQGAHGSGRKQTCKQKITKPQDACWWRRPVQTIKITTLNQGLTVTLTHHKFPTDGSWCLLKMPEVRHSLNPLHTLSLGGDNFIKGEWHLKGSVVKSLGSGVRWPEGEVLSNSLPAVWSWPSHWASVAWSVKCTYSGPPQKALAKVK